MSVITTPGLFVSHVCACKLLLGVCLELSPRCVCYALAPQGPGKGTPCIDDYIKSAEPVYDYLTKFRSALPVMSAISTVL